MSPPVCSVGAFEMHVVTSSCVLTFTHTPVYR